MGKVSKREVLSFGNIVKTMRETAQGIRIVKAFTLESAMRGRMADSVAAVERVNNKMVSVNAGVNPMIDTIGGFAVAGVIFYAGWRSLTYNETPGEFFSFITALLMAYEPARRLARLQVRLKQACIGVGMMYELIDSQPALLDRPVREVMEAPLPVIESSFPTDRLGPMLTRESPAALVRKDGQLVGIVSRYDVLQQLIGTR